MKKSMIKITLALAAFSPWRHAAEVASRATPPERECCAICSSVQAFPPISSPSRRPRDARRISERRTFTNIGYESEIQFPDGYEAKCAEEKERGPCALLGIAADQTFQKNEILKSEGSLHFSKTGKGWAARTKNDY